MTSHSEEKKYRCPDCEGAEPLTKIFFDEDGKPMDPLYRCSNCKFEFEPEDIEEDVWIDHSF